MTGPDAPLEGVLVADFSRVLAGPSATPEAQRLLADPVLAASLGRAAREAVTLDELALTAYEAQRPAAEEACRLGDERFFPENH